MTSRDPAFAFRGSQEFLKNQEFLRVVDSVATMPRVGASDADYPRPVIRIEIA